MLVYSVPPSIDDKETFLDRQTQAAAQALADPRWSGKTVVMVWEHKHIANQKLEQDAAHPVTLRKLLGLDRLARVPLTWPGSNYDYFWIVDYTNGAPTAFRKQKQIFPAPYQDIPTNDWDNSNPQQDTNDYSEPQQNTKCK